MAQEEAYWLAAYTRPRHEHKVLDYCEKLGNEVFLPTYRTRRQWSDRSKFVELPLFPSYVFVRIYGGQHQQVVRAPGLLWFVHNRFGSIRVDASELNAVRMLLTSGLRYDPLPTVQIGEEVEIVAGALKGCRGRLIRKNTGSIFLTISAINGGVRVELPDPSWVMPVASHRY